MKPVFLKAEPESARDYALLLVESGDNTRRFIEDLLSLIPEKTFRLDKVENLQWAAQVLRQESYHICLVDLDTVKLEKLPEKTLAKSLPCPVLALSSRPLDPADSALAGGWLLKSEITPNMFEKFLHIALEAACAKQAEHALRETEILTRPILEGLSEGVAFTGVDGTLLYANSRLAAMTGFSLAELTGRNQFETFVPFDQNKQFAEHGRSSGGQDHFEVELRRKDGGRFWARISQTAVHDQNSRLIGNVALIVDVTERREMLEDLKESETKYRNIVETSSDMIWSVDRDGRWTFVNQTVRSIFGYEPEEMLGRHFYDFQQPEIARRDIEVHRQILKGRRYFRYETEYLRKDGTPVPLSLNAIVHLDDHGRVIGSTGTAADLTERRRSEEALRLIVEGTASATTSEEFFRSLVYQLSKVLNTHYAFVGRIIESAPEYVETLAVWWEDRYHENFTFQIAGTPSETVIGKSIKVYQRNLHKLFPSDRHAGETQAEGYMGAPIFDSDGKPLGLLTVWDKEPIEDWPPAWPIMKIFAARAGAEMERLRAEDEARVLGRQLVQSQKMEAIGQLAAGVAHDLNNALGAVVGHLQLMRMNPALDPDLDHSTSVALSGCERASSLIEQLLGFSRQGKYNLCEVSIVNAVNDTIGFLGKVIGKDIQIAKENPSEDLHVMADEGQLQQVLVNLIINAKQAMPRGGTISFIFGETTVTHPERYNSRARPGNFVTVSVSDTGVGIPAEHIDKIFEPFFSTKAESKGTGLGLSMVYGIMQNHGGWIEVRSEAGKGATFTLYFPKATRRAVAVDRKVETVKPVMSGMVMVVDDEPALVELAVMFLKKAGISAQGFVSAEEALKWFEGNASQVEFVILDMRMPGMDGSECFQRLREISPQVQVVVLSGFMEDEAVQTLLRRGAACFFQKPLKYPDLVQWLLDRSRFSTKAR